jgi:flavorubredoxin
MFTYIKELKVLISCDAFGAHFASDAILLSHEKNKEGYQKALRFYFEKVMSPFSSYVLQACERVSKLDIDMICPGHGPVIDADVRKQIAAYRALAEETLPANDPNKVTIVFATAYGYTRDMADYLRKSFAEAGKKVDFYEISALNFANIFPEIRKSILTSGLILFGSPTIIGDAVGYFYEILNSIHWTEAQGKKASAFGDFGWSGEAVKNLSERLEELHFKVIPGFKWNFKMDADGHKELAEYYKRLSE